MAIQKESPASSSSPSSAPIWVEAGGYYRVSRHEDIVAICLNPQTFSSNLVAFVLQGTSRTAEIFEVPAGIPRPKDVLAIADAPDHTLQRKRLNPFFNAKALSTYGPLAESLAKTIAQDFMPRGDVEWMSEFATPLPLRLIMTILGLPEEDVEQLKTWSDAGVRIVDGTASGGDLMTLAGLLLEFQAYLGRALRAARGGSSQHLISQLAGLVDQGDFDEDEAVSILLQLIVAGSDSTASLIGALAHRLAASPELQARARREPELRTTIIEEVLRLEAPFQGHFRVLSEDALVGGVAMKKGARLMLHWGEANRDQEVFGCPSKLDPNRSEIKKHLGFGYGIHRCIGAGLARIEAHAALDILLNEMTSVRIRENTQPVHQASTFTRKLESLQLVFD